MRRVLVIAFVLALGLSFTGCSICRSKCAGGCKPACACKSETTSIKCKCEKKADCTCKKGERRADCSCKKKDNCVCKK